MGGGPSRASPALFTWVCLERYPEGSGLMGIVLLWDVLGPSYNLALKRNCVPGALQRLQPYLVWKLLFAWRTSGGSKQTSHLGGQSLNYARMDRPVCELF